MQFINYTRGRSGSSAGRIVKGDCDALGVCNYTDIDRFFVGSVSDRDRVRALLQIECHLAAFIGLGGSVVKFAVAVGVAFAGGACHIGFVYRQRVLIKNGYLDRILNIRAFAQAVL